MSMDQRKAEHHHRILVIDDNPAIHEDFRKILCPANPVDAQLREDETALFGGGLAADPQSVFEIDSAFQGKEGLAMVRAALAEGRPYAMAFVDVRMPPGWDGVETVGQIWKSYPQLQVVICTAYADYSWNEMTKQLGHSDNMVILKKPFDNIEVLQLAHALTKKWLLSRQAQTHMEDLDRMVHKRTRELALANAKLIEEIQARNQTEAALRSSEARFKQAFGANPLAMAIQTFKEERYLEVNDSFLRLTRLSREELVGRTPANLPPIFTPETRSRVREHLTVHQRVSNLDCQVLQPSGAARQTVLWVESFPIGAETLMLVIVQDVSERVQLEAQLRQIQKNEAVGQLASGIAHDFNNLLTVIQGHASLRLSCQDLDRDIKESMEAVSAAAARAAKLTRQLLAFGRQQALQRKTLDINHLITNLGNMVSRALGDHTELVWKPPEEALWVHADAGQIEHVLMNLILNGKDAMAAGGTITLSTETVTVDPEYVGGHADARPGRFVVLSVKDTGCGMDAATQDRLFEPFFTTKDVGQGVGMGLAMVYGISKQHDGWVEVTSQAGQGSTFRVFLPAAGADVVKSEVVSSPAPPDPTRTRGSEGILVVEDEPSLRELVSRILQRSGYHVTTANDGVEALDIWQSRHGDFDLLLTDVVMPNGISGKRLAQILQTENPRLKVIYTSGYSREVIAEAEDLREGYNLLCKPYAPQNLLQAVRSRLDG